MKGQERGSTPEESKGRSSQVSVPAISLPKGGGAIRGMGEKFAANPVTGTGSTSVPLAVSPGRAGFGPQLSLSYDSGGGNGPFGFGWSLSLPSITRKTDKGLPTYQDAGESDVFILSGSEELVPALLPDGTRFTDHTTVPGFTIYRYRPRIEGLFARIERWTRQADGDVHWRSLSKDNILTLYGKDANARIVDPTDPRRIFSWLICETRDDKGNALLYEYKREDGAGVDLTRAHEHNRGGRDDPRRRTNRYLKRIRYGNRVPLLDAAGQRPRLLTDAQIQNAGWMFEVVFDYGEHDTHAPGPVDAGEWTCRPDAFSSYRAGFEVRTSRLCQRVLMFHHFAAEEGVGNDCLVRSTDFTYSHEQDPDNASTPVYTFLLSVTQSGYRRNIGGYVKRSVPPVEFEYSQPIVEDTVHDVDAESLKNLPVGLDGTAYQWIDLHGEGIPGILTGQRGAWFYTRNLSAINVRTGTGAARTEAKFAPVELVDVRPNLTLAGGQTQFMDLAGDGQSDLVVLDGPMPGLYEHDPDEGWQRFRPFTSRLNRSTRDPNLRFVDLDGDGHTDVLISEDDAFVWHASRAEKGFGPAHRVAHALDEEKGPRLIFADGTESIYLADVSGDGLTDLVRLRNGEVCYWPNLGYGRFGAKVTMDHAPLFDKPDQFDHRRIRLADIDGSGTTDIIYLHRDGVCIYFNQSGNSWSAPQPLGAFPRVDDLVAIHAIDLLGNGTACLVWSSPLPADARRQMRYVDLMGGTKPHLLTRTVNSQGVETRVEYAPSTRFYLQDKRAGKPWITRLPFPVHVVERVETVDAINGNRCVTRHAYHHGHFDGEEREFRGFGMVEQWDTEEFAAPTGDASLSLATNLDAASHVPPVLTRTWFHTGMYAGRDHVSDFFAGLLDAHDRGEYYREPGLTDAQARQLLLPDTVLPPGLTLEEEREASRALKGAMLRQEVYARDGTGKAEIPYTVAERNFSIQLVQPRAGNRHAVFFTHAREAFSYHYERDPADPRISHALTLEVDAYGNVLKSLAIGYGRRIASTDPVLTADDKDTQTRLLITFTENRFTQAVVGADHHRTPLPAEVRTSELTGFTPENGAARFSFDEWTRNGFALLASAAGIPYEQSADQATRQKRLIEHVRTLYRRDDLTALLPLGEVEALALPGESYQLALTPGLLARVFKRRRPGQPDEDLLPNPGPLLTGKGADQGGYVAMDGNWWIPSGRVFFAPDANVANPANTAAQELLTARQHFYLPRKAADPFGHSTVVDYDAGHDLLVVRTSDAMANTVRAVNDYRVLQPRLVIDPNGNRTAAAFDARGLPVATAAMGKEAESVGDLLEDFDADPPLGDLQAFIADPRAHAASLLGKATTRSVYDLERYDRAGQPPFAATLARETHFHDAGGAPTKIQISFSYFDGFGREIQQKVQAEAGDAPQRQLPVSLPSGDVRPGDLVRNAEGQPVPANTSRRWVGTGRTIVNNKGKPVRQYEPFFSATHLYEPEREMTDTGVSAVLFYDPVERVVATLHPNHTWEKVVFDPWRQETWDVNDTVLVADPKTDLDVGDFFRRLPEADYLPTWYSRRQDGALGPHEQAAARRAAVHAATPAVAHADVLGRAFRTLAHNAFKYSDAPAADPRTEQFHLSRVVFDIEGNEREVIDANERLVMRYDYDMLGNRIHQASMEAGERWILNDVTEKPIRAWDSRNHQVRTTYDPLRRPADSFLREGAGAELLVGRTVYGETRPNPEGRNLRGQPVQFFDQAGVVTSDDYDFKGNLLRSQRQLAQAHNTTLNWPTVPLDADIYTSRTRYDALNRPTELITPHTPAMPPSVIRPGYNDANLLERVDANLRDAAVATPFVADIDYDAKGQRTLIDYGNGVRTTYEYDPLTFRLVQVLSRRDATLFPDDCPRPPTVGWPGCLIQNLRYTYDPVGNITHIRDEAQQTIFFSNKRVEPSAEYTYDALYRLIEATGREHLGQAGAPPPPDSYNDKPRVGILRSASDGNAMARYLQRYVYDAVGNFQRMIHRGTSPVNPGWTRAYAYDEPSLLEPVKRSNRLTSTTIGATTEIYSTGGNGYDAHGSMLQMPHLQVMQWDFQDQPRMTRRQAVNAEDEEGQQHQGERTWTVYDAGGQRVRKVTELATGQVKDERIYLGEFEIYRRHGVNPVVRETLHVIDDKQRIASVETRAHGDDGSPLQSIRYQFGNHLGSATLELDDQSQVISYEEYYPYGSTSFQAVRSQTETPKRYRYTGMERDEETGFSYHSARYYAPWLGRWTSCDPLDPRVTHDDRASSSAAGPSSHSSSPSNASEPVRGETSIWNLFAYCNCNPVLYCDLNGLNPSREGGVAHRDVLPILMKRINDLTPQYYTAEINSKELWPGSTVRKKMTGVGEIDLRIFATGGGWHVYDLKPLGTSGSSTYGKQIYDYTVKSKGLLAATVGTVLERISLAHPDVLGPIEVQKSANTIRTYYLSLPIDRKTGRIRPGFIEYTFRDSRRRATRQQQRDAPVDEKLDVARKVVSVATMKALADAAQAQAARTVAVRAAVARAAATFQEIGARAIAAESAAAAAAAEGGFWATVRGGLSRMGNRLNNFLVVPGFLFKREEYEVQ
jgi:RHS repeat-associated protein